MTVDQPPTLPAPPHAGLCATCCHARVVRSDRGSVFVLCGLARRDARFARYPTLPVTCCDGYEAWDEAASDSSPGSPSAPR